MQCDSLSLIQEDISYYQEHVGELPEVCLGSETAIDIIRDWFFESVRSDEEMSDGLVVEIFGISFLRVPDEYAITIPEIGLDHVYYCTIDVARQILRLPDIKREC